MPDATAPPSAETTRTDLPVRLKAGEDAPGPPDGGIALCLSGGGYRAMLFHVGTIWRLNEAGLLPKLTRVSSVSGGSITAGVLGLNWHKLRFDSAGVAQDFQVLAGPIGHMAGYTVDEWSVISGALLPGSISDRVADAYDKHLFKKATLQDLPADADGPRFVINATSMQTGTLWRFSRPYMGDYQVGLIDNPTVPLARAVAASSAFPPILSPATLRVRPEDFSAKNRGRLANTPPYNEEVVLTDGGVYDNLGLETAFKRCRTLLVSDAGQRMQDEGKPKHDWPRQAVRVLGLIDNQVRALRKRQLIEAYDDRTGSDRSRYGAYWGIGTDFGSYAAYAKAHGGPLPDPLNAASADPQTLAGIPTRLKAVSEAHQQKLTNWGYAICDAALRTHFAADAGHVAGVTIGLPKGLPYPAAGY